MSDELSKELEKIKEITGQEIFEGLCSVIQVSYLPIWFYRPIVKYSNQSPHDLCLNGHKEELGRIVYFLSAGEAF